MYLFQFSTCFEQPRAHHQANQLYQYNIWYMSLCVGGRFVRRSERNEAGTYTEWHIPDGTFWPAHETATYTEWHIPDVVLIQLILLMMSTRSLETC